ncbi:hypothetical protein [Alienimonas chondri]|nr:hypothetical protein [Alienimonas chondri]
MQTTHQADRFDDWWREIDCQVSGLDSPWDQEYPHLHRVLTQRLQVCPEDERAIGLFDSIGSGLIPLNAVQAFWVMPAAYGEALRTTEPGFARVYVKSTQMILQAACSSKPSLRIGKARLNELIESARDLSHVGWEDELRLRKWSKNLVLARYGYGRLG